MPGQFRSFSIAYRPSLKRWNAGTLCNYGPNILTNECDLLIAIGMRFDRVTGDLNTYAKQVKIIHFEIDPAEVNKNVKANIPVIGNCKESLTALLPLVQKKSHSKWLQRLLN